MLELIQKRIDGALQDLHDFHQNTFDYEDCEWLKGKEDLTGQEIYNYTYDMEMTRQEDACYMAGKIDAYEDIARELKALKLEIGLTYEDIDDLSQDKALDWNFNGIDVHLFNEDENPS
jgi:hypothetical protein